MTDELPLNDSDYECEAYNQDIYDGQEMENKEFNEFKFELACKLFDAVQKGDWGMIVKIQAELLRTK